MNRRRRVYFLIALILIGIIFPYTPWGAFLRVELPEIVLAPEILFHFPVTGFEFPVSNTLLTSWIVMAILILGSFLGTRRMKLLPSRLQNLLEVAIEAILSLVNSVAGEERGKKFFPVVATIFLYVLLSNWLGLVPGFGPIGLKETVPPGEEAGEILIPIFRSPSTDINMALALALVSVGLTQVYGMQALGVGGYIGKFINLRRIIQFFIPGKDKKAGGRGRIGLLIQGLLDLFIGAIELVSEAAKILSFTFRLLGNIFAGEVVLLIMAFFAPFFLPLIFFAFETFVGFIQAFIFAVLTLVFMTLATTSHEIEEGY
ncbi:MAG: F0F1 ATP synthase subunit A [Chloroflexi bacterium]|nr:F0F1 ATP synthase subunit A [Chloroflexota bacterium]